MLPTDTRMRSRAFASGETRRTLTRGILSTAASALSPSTRPAIVGRVRTNRRNEEAVVESTGKAAVAEFVATFALIFIGAGPIAVSLGLDLTGVALAHGLVLAIMVSITAHISGGQVNPGVTIGLWVARKIPSRRAVILMGAQLLGAVAGAFLLKYLAPRALFDAGGGGTPALAQGIAAGKGIVIEATTTFLLVFAVFGTAVDPRGLSRRRRDSRSVW